MESSEVAKEEVVQETGDLNGAKAGPDTDREAGESSGVLIQLEEEAQDDLRTTRKRKMILNKNGAVIKKGKKSVQNDEPPTASDEREPATPEPEDPVQEEAAAENDKPSCSTSSKDNDSTVEDDNDSVQEDDDDSDWVEYGDHDGMFEISDDYDRQLEIYFSQRKFSDYRPKPEPEEEQVATEQVGVGTEEVPIITDDVALPVQNIVAASIEQAVACAQAISGPVRESAITRWKNMVARGGSSVATVRNAVEQALGCNVAPGAQQNTKRTPEQERINKELRKKILFDITTETVKIIIREMEPISECFESQRVQIEKELKESMSQPIVFECEKAQELAKIRRKKEIIRRQVAVSTLTAKFNRLLSALQRSATHELKYFL
ncbi:uncharacterized protein LOC105841884 [Bombyx mori]|uniref:Uncharacterized protein n=1 Tax=Bombyx mori TaxID=7091 RepID=A0A8R2LW58_BOMMO|nr:uncharacterized protein LOC105841884 [Bombyx mori]